MAMATKCIEGDGKHKLKKKNYKRPYTCYGCEEKGVGPRHRCDQCSYEFHESCAPTDPSKPLSCEFTDSKFSLLKSPPPKPGYTYYCNTCGNIVKGFVLQGEILHENKPNPIYLHPCCGKLKKCLKIKKLKFDLINTVENMCMGCYKIQPPGSKIKGWSYRSECKNYHVHVSCVTQMAFAKENNNLYHNDITYRTSSTLMEPKSLYKHINNGKKTDMATEVFMFTAETILSTFFGGSAIFMASLAIRFLFK